MFSYITIAQQLCMKIGDDMCSNIKCLNEYCSEGMKIKLMKVASKVVNVWGGLM